MSSILGKIISSTGEFQVIGSDGSLRDVMVGDKIRAGEKIVGDSSNVPSDVLTVELLDESKVLVLNTQIQQFDSYLLDESLLVNSDEQYEDIVDIETAAGEENPTVMSTEQGNLTFAKQNSAIADINSELSEQPSEKDVEEAKNHLNDEDSRLRLLQDANQDIDTNQDPVAVDDNTMLTSTYVMDFGGSEDYVTLGDELNEVFGSSSNSFNVTLTINPDSLSDAKTNHNVKNVIVAKASDPYNDNFELGVDTDGSLLVYIDTQGRDTVALNIGSGIVIGEDNFISVSYDDGVLTVNINGTDYTNTTYFASSNTNLDQAIGSPFTIGASTHIDTYFDGQISGVTVHSSALSDADVLAMQNGDIVGDAVAAFDFTAENPLVDLSGNDNNGSIVGDVTHTLLQDQIIVPLSTDEDSAVSVDVLANDLDVDSDTLSIVEIEGQDVSGGATATISDFSGNILGTAVVVNETIEFTPSEFLQEMDYGESQDVTFSYSVSDGDGGVATAEVTINVKGSDDLDPDDHVVAHWDFKSDYEDSAVAGVEDDDGSKVGDATVDSDGILKLDGSGDWVDIGNSNDINLGTHSTRTITFNFKADVDGVGKQIIYEEGASVRGLNIYLDDGQISVGGWNTPANESDWSGTWLSGPDVLDGEWHQVSLVLDGGVDSNLTDGTLTGYLDGISFGSGEASQLWAHSGDVNIGASSDTLIDGAIVNNVEFKGEISDGKIYDIALDSEQIESVYEEADFPIIGTNGDDYIEGTSVSDTIKAGDGHDTIVFDAIDNVVDGGNGFDTLMVENSIDFSSLDTEISNIENISLDTAGSQDIKLTLDDVLNMTDANNRLHINGTDEDSVYLETDEWNMSATQSEAGFNDYVSSQDPTVQLQIDDSIIVIEQ